MRLLTCIYFNYSASLSVLFAQFTPYSQRECYLAALSPAFTTTHLNSSTVPPVSPSSFVIVPTVPALLASSTYDKFTFPQDPLSSNTMNFAGALPFLNHIRVSRIIVASRRLPMHLDEGDFSPTPVGLTSH